MHRLKTIILVLTAILLWGGCTNTRYLTDPTSIGRQRDMKKSRTGGNIEDVGTNFASFLLTVFFNISYDVSSGERAFKRISLVNESADSLYVNMVTDIVWKESGYCDIMGIELPPGAKQKLLVPYPAAYNIYFRSPFSEVEEKLEVLTENKRRQIKLKEGMTLVGP